MAHTRSWSVIAAAFAALVLTACGGGETLGGGTTGGGTGGTGVPAVLTVTAAQSVIPADGVATVLISAVLTDAAGNPISRRELNFTTTAGTIVASSGATDSSGVSEVFIRAPLQRGTATVIVRESETDVTGSVVVQFASGAVAQLSAGASPTLIAPGGVTALTVVALDESNNPVTGEIISFDVLPATGGTLGQVTAQTDDNGRATTTFTASANTGSVTLRARTASGLNANTSITVATQAALQLAVTPSQNSILANGTATVVISAVLTDSGGVPLPNRTIEFTTNAGTLLATSAVTDANGLATATLRSSTVRGIATVTARETGTDVSGSTAVQFVSGSATTVQATLSPSTVSPGNSATLTALVRDERDNPVAGQIVSFDTPNGAGGGEFQQSSVTTDVNGRAVGTFVAGSTGGSFTLRARIASGASGSAALTVSQPDALLALSATPTTVVADGQSTVQITATLTDLDNQPLANRTVIFTTSSGALLKSSSLTNASGVARVSLRASQTAGRANINAQVAGSNASAAVVVQFTAGPATQISFSINPTRIAPGGTAAATAVVEDANGNPVSGESVTFSAATTGSGTFSPASTSTGASGIAASTFTAGSTNGTFTLSASTASGLNDTAQLTIAAGVVDVTLLSSLPELRSSADTIAEGVTITAIVRGAGNKLVVNAKVDFSSDQGALQVLNNGLTDSTGAARAILTTGGNPRNQDVVITAVSEGATKSITIPVTGTTLQVVGASIVGSGDTEKYVITLLDADNNPIPNQTVQVTSATLGNTVTFVGSAVTKSNGSVTVNYTGVSGGSDVLQATSIGVVKTFPITVSALKLVFAAPTLGAGGAQPEVLFNTCTPVNVVLTQNGTPVSGTSISFATTRGAIYSDSACTVGGGQTLSATTGTAVGIPALDGPGKATVFVLAMGAGNAGGTVISASAGTDVSASFALEFVATTPATLTLQANPAVVPVNGTASIRAIVRDADNNLVKNQRVNFVLSDTTGGSLSAAFGITDSVGSVSVTYRATATSSATNGVRVTGTIPLTAITKAVTLTVGNQGLRILLGTGNVISEPTPTTYAMPWVAIVTDSAGNPPPTNTVFRISIEPIAYQKGIYVPAPALSPDHWAASYSIAGADLQTSPLTPTPPDFGCINEDINRNGILDVSNGDVDENTNGTLQPGGVAVVNGTPTLNANGTAAFDVTYPQTHGNWVQVRLRAEAVVAGTESVETADFVLPVLASDVNDLNSAPPGFLYGNSIGSPYGTLTPCSNAN